MAWLATDLDGTLITCEPRQSAVLRAALGMEGAAIDPARVWCLKREGASTASALMKSGLGPHASRGIADKWQRMIENPGWLCLDRTFDGVGSVLAAMRQAGWSLLLLTARSRREWLPWQLARLGLADFFDEVAAVSPGAAPEEKAGILARISAHAFFGDTEADAKAATIAKVPFFPISAGQRSAAFLNTHNKCPVYASLAEAWAALPRPASPAAGSLPS